MALAGSLVFSALTMRHSRQPASRVRVLHVTHELSLTGAPRLALELFRALGDTIELRTVSGSGGGLEAGFRELGPVEVLNGLPGPWKNWRHPAQPLVVRGVGRIRAPAVGLLERRWRPDVLYVNSVAAITLVPRLGLEGVATLVHVHELSAGLDRLSDSHRALLVTLPHRYLAVSEVVADELINRRGIPRDRVSVLLPPIDLARIDDMAAEAGPHNDHAGSRALHLVGGAGNPHWTKGIELWLLMARALVDRMGPDAVEFEWVGVRENHAVIEFRAMIEKLGLQANVRLVAETPNPYARYRRFDVFAMTSWEESASLVVLESMALKVPVVCFGGSGGPREEVGDTAVVIDTFSPSAMADAIAALLVSPARRAEIGARERARAATVYSPERVARQLSAEFDALADRGDAR